MTLLNKTLLIVCIAGSLAGCARIPKEMPQLMRLNNERLSTLSTVLYRNNTYLVDQIKFLESDVAELEQRLSGLDVSALGAAQKAEVASIIKELTAIKTGIAKTLSPTVIRFPEVSRKSLRELVLQYETVADMLQTSIDNKAQITDLLNRAEQSAKRQSEE